MKRTLIALLVIVTFVASGCGGGAIQGGYGACGIKCEDGLACNEATGRCEVVAANGGGSGGGTATGGGSGGGTVADLPCDVAAVVTDSCSQCHGAVLAGGAPVRLLTRADFAAPSYADATKSFGERSVLRMRATSGAMPPAPMAPVTGTNLGVFEAWVTAGMPTGSCQATSSDAGVPDAGPVTPYDGGIAGLPCNVATFVASNCTSCHRPGGGTSGINLLSRDDFLAPSPTHAGQTVGQRSVTRLNDTVSPMPPVGSPRPSSTDVADFTTWVNTGMPAGTCGTVDPPDAGPAPTTCTSTSYWTGGNSESPNMNPGLACLSCHQQRAPDKAYAFSGTVFPSLHEKNLCNARPPSGTRVEIIDRNGNVAVTMTVSTTSGNFHSSLFPSVALPYTARVVTPTGTATMTTAQTNGDCNTCHTEQGTNGASGRIAWP